MNSVQQVCARWRIPPQALLELSDALMRNGAPLQSPPRVVPRSEHDVQDMVRVDARRVGMRLFRNNVGAGKVGVSQSYIRWGLGNESERLLKSWTSSDLIGWTAKQVDFTMIGQTVAIFTAIECKKPGWQFGKDSKEDKARAAAQQKFHTFVEAAGGIAGFNSTGRL